MKVKKSVATNMTLHDLNTQLRANTKKWGRSKFTIDESAHRVTLAPNGGKEGRRAWGKEFSFVAVENSFFFFFFNKEKYNRCMASSWLVVCLFCLFKMLLLSCHLSSLQSTSIVIVPNCTDPCSRNWQLKLPLLVSFDHTGLNFAFSFCVSLIRSAYHVRPFSPFCLLHGTHACIPFSPLLHSWVHIHPSQPNVDTRSQLVHGPFLHHHPTPHPSYPFLQLPLASLSSSQSLCSFSFYTKRFFFFLLLGGMLQGVDGQGGLGVHPRSVCVSSQLNVAVFFFVPFLLTLKYDQACLDRAVISSVPSI